MEEQIEQPVSQVEQARQQVEQEALDKFRSSQQNVQEQITGQSDELPEGFNEDGTPIEETTTTDEPILGKFKSQEDLVRAYQELEKKLSKGETVEEATKTDEVVNSDGVAVDVKQFDTEYRENGSLSEDSYKALEKQGFSKEDVDRYIAGQEALAKQYTSTIYDTVGGQDNYNNLVTWSADNLPPETVEEYNTALTAGNLPKVQQLLEYMTFKAQGAIEQKPNRVTPTSTNESGGLKAFADKGEWQRATANRLYGKDVKYTNMIDKRYLASKRNGTI